MFLKHFTAVPQPVPDPMRPNRTVNVTRLVDSRSSVHSDGGVVYRADGEGWFEFPQDVGQRLRSFRVRGSGWYAEGEVADAVRLGTVERPDAPERKQEEPARRPRRRLEEGE